MREQSLELIATAERVYATPKHRPSYVFVLDVKRVVRGVFSAAEYVFELSCCVYEGEGITPAEGRLLSAMGCELDRESRYYVCTSREEVTLSVGGGLMLFRWAGGKEVRLRLDWHGVRHLSAAALIAGAEYVSASGSDNFKLSDLQLTHLCYRRGQHAGGEPTLDRIDVFSSELPPGELVARYRESLKDHAFTQEGGGGTWVFPAPPAKAEVVVAVLPVGSDGPHRACGLKPPAGARSIVFQTSPKK